MRGHDVLVLNQKDRGLWKLVEVLKELPSVCSQWRSGNIGRGDDFKNYIMPLNYYGTKQFFVRFS